MNGLNEATETPEEGSNPAKFEDTKGQSSKDEQLSTTAPPLCNGNESLIPANENNNADNDDSNKTKDNQLKKSPASRASRDPTNHVDDQEELAGDPDQKDQGMI